MVWFRGVPFICPRKGPLATTRSSRGPAISHLLLLLISHLIPPSSPSLLPFHSSLSPSYTATRTSKWSSGAPRTTSHSSPSTPSEASCCWGRRTRMRSWRGPRTGSAFFRGAEPGDNVWGRECGAGERSGMFRMLRSATHIHSPFSVLCFLPPLPSLPPQAVLLPLAPGGGGGAGAQRL
jgi:hypothetical protein